MSAWSTQIGGNHYKQFPIQPSLFCERNKLTHLESSVIKYVTRHRFKGNGRDDILKARHYCDLLLEEYYTDPEIAKDQQAVDAAVYGS